MKKIFTKLSLFFLVMLMLFSINCSCYASELKLFVTSDKAIEDKWYKTSLQDESLIIQTKKIFQNQEFMVLIVVTNPGIGADGRANIEYNLKVIGEYGNVLGEKNQIKVIDEPITNQPVCRLSTQLPVLALNDLPGQYTIQVTVKDKNAKTTETLEESIVLRKYFYSTYFYGVDAYNQWVYNYYLKANPEKAIAGLFYFSKIDQENLDKNKFFFYGFFAQIFKDNQYLYPEVLHIYSKLNDETKKMIRHLVLSSKYDYRSFLSQMSAEDKEYFTNDDDAKYIYPANGIEVNPQNLADAINVAGQLDMLWGTFFAEGRYEPIKHIVDVLDYGKYKGSMDVYKKTKSLENEKKAAAELVFQAAKWSLESNCKNNKLVKDYCNYIYENEKISLQVKNELKEILER